MMHHRSMAEALRLTRTGSLLEATALLQAALGSSKSVQTPAPDTTDPMTSVPERIPFAASGLKQARSAAEMKPQVRDPDASSRFEARTFRGGQGPMIYWLYRPARIAAGAPLVVMLHGCTQSPEDFARGTQMNLLADELGFVVAYPQQSPAANPQKCWNWFRPGDQHRDRGEPGQLAGITRQIIAECHIDQERVYIAGLSAGGAAAAIMAAQYPELYAAVGIHSGLGCGIARDIPSALSAMRRGGATLAAPSRQPFVPVITFHGDHDATVSEVNSRQIVAAASAASGKSLTVRMEKGRSVSGRRYTCAQSVDSAGTVIIEQWTVEGSGHAWSGGDASGSYTDPTGPEASRAMMRFFLGTKRT